jgi:hypothetical protein
LKYYAAEKRSNALNDFTGISPVADNSIDGLTYSFEIWGISREPAKRGMAICDDGGQRLMISCVIDAESSAAVAT